MWAARRAMHTDLHMVPAQLHSWCGQLHHRGRPQPQHDALGVATLARVHDRLRTCLRAAVTWTFNTLAVTDVTLLALVWVGRVQTGMHEFRRDIMPHFAGSNQWQLVAIGIVVAIVIAVYASYFQVDLGTSCAVVYGGPSAT